MWVAWLEAFSRGDDKPTDHLPTLALDELGSVGARRVSERCEDALNRRLGVWSRVFNSDLTNATDAHALRIALIRCRRRLEPLRQLANSALLFHELREAMTIELERAIASAQAELEDHVRRDLHARKEVLAIVLEQPLTQPITLEIGDSEQVPLPHAGRRVLLS